MKPPIVHELKCWPEYFQATKAGLKDFEIRLNDRDYKVGDKLCLREWCPKEQNYTWEHLYRDIKYMTDYCQQEGYVVLGLEVES